MPWAIERLRPWRSHRARTASATRNPRHRCYVHHRALHVVLDHLLGRGLRDERDALVDLCQRRRPSRACPARSAGRTCGDAQHRQRLLKSDRRPRRASLMAPSILSASVTSSTTPCALLLYDPRRYTGRRTRRHGAPRSHVSPCCWPENRAKWRLTCSNLWSPDCADLCNSSRHRAPRKARPLVREIKWKTISSCAPPHPSSRAAEVRDPGKPDLRPRRPRRSSRGRPAGQVGLRARDRSQAGAAPRARLAPHAFRTHAPSRRSRKIAAACRPPCRSDGLVIDFDLPGAIVGNDDQHRRLWRTAVSTSIALKPNAPSPVATTTCRSGNARLAAIPTARRCRGNRGPGSR